MQRCGCRVRAGNFAALLIFAGHCKRHSDTAVIMQVGDADRSAKPTVTPSQREYRSAAAAVTGRHPESTPEFASQHFAGAGSNIVVVPDGLHLSIPNIDVTAPRSR